MGRGSGVHKEEKKKVEGSERKLEGRAQLETAGIPSQSSMQTWYLCVSVCVCVYLYAEERVWSRGARRRKGCGHGASR